MLTRAAARDFWSQCAPFSVWRREFQRVITHSQYSDLGERYGFPTRRCHLARWQTYRVLESNT